MGRAKTFDIAGLHVVFGPQAITGFHTGTVVEVEQGSPRYTKLVGADGEVARSASNDGTAKVTLTLMQTSPSNDYLATIAELDAAKLPGGVLPFLLQDSNGRTMVSSADAWIAEVPKLDFAQTVEGRKWVIDLGKTAFFPGGN